MHTIRLREPWQANWLEDAARVATGVARYERKFNRPTGIDGAPVSLCIALDALHRDQLSVALNDIPLGMRSDEPGKWSVPVAEQLQPFNRLVLLVRAPRSAPHAAIPPLSSIGEICLQIEDSP